MRYFLPRPSYRRAWVMLPAALIPVLEVGVSLAQSQVVDPSGGGGGAGGGDRGGGSGTSTQYTYPGAVAPPLPGQPIGGGNTAESNHFTIGTGGGSAGTVFNPNGSAILGGDSVRMGETLITDPYVVRKGDTLWGICDSYYHNPYQWPRVWSYNPQLQNPHWIYPGDLIHLSVPGGPASNGGAQASVTPSGSDGGSFVDRRRQVVPDTIFLRDMGFIDDANKDDWGEVSGAPVDKIFLTDTDEVYVRIGPGHDVKIGQELTIFRPIKSAGDGKLVQIQGTVRIDQWDPKTRIARAMITETLDTVERGARVGPVGRQFNKVPPVRNAADVVANVLASIYPHNFFGQNQVVFIDKGDQDGLKPGNRLFVIRRGDAWKKSLASDVAGNRIALESDSPAAIERVPGPPVDSKLPEEVLAELRVLTTREHTAACLVTQSRREIELGDDAVARKGY